MNIPFSSPRGRRPSSRAGVPLGALPAGVAAAVICCCCRGALVCFSVIAAEGGALCFSYETSVQNFCPFFCIYFISSIFKIDFIFKSSFRFMKKLCRVLYSPPSTEFPCDQLMSVCCML